MNKDYKWLWFVIILLWMFWMLLLLVTLKVFWDSCEALSCGSTKMPTVVKGEVYEWTTDDQIWKLIKEAEIEPEPVVRDFRTTEKQKVVANVISKEVKRDNYTIRVGLEGRMKPIPNLYGQTTDDRAFEWLSESGLHFTKDTWRAYWEKYKIDFTVPICVAWADSHLGKALKSKNNIGNVWNDDRGRTREYETLEAWIEAIFWHLAKWKYMSGHNTIWTLSGEGRKRLWLPWCAEEKDYRKKCYASSMGVWSTNVTNCMSAIHDRKIDENFEFRTQ